MRWIDTFAEFLQQIPTTWIDDIAGQVGVRLEVLLAVAVGLALLFAVGLVVLFVKRRRRARGHVRPESREEALARGLGKTRQGLLGRLAPLLGRREVDAAALEELETALLVADVGVQTTERLLAAVRAGDAASGEDVGARLRAQLQEILETATGGAPDVPEGPRVIMVVGVNGAGKTTSIGKLACRYTSAGRRVVLVAGDTFRAAAAEQLAIWAERAGAEIVQHQPGGDPGAVVYDGMRAAIARGADIVIIDTAGRLHTKTNLMDELRKVRRVVARELPGAPHETFLVLDAVTGQNGVAQARAFVGDLAVNGVILTKLDGTAKGGVVIAIAGELGIPVRFIGVGEGIEDLREFDAADFVEALLAPVRLDTQAESPVDSR